MRRNLMVAALGVVLALGFSAASATAVSAAPISCAGWVVDANGPGEGATIEGANMKVGPYATCGNVVYVPAGTYVYYWCYIVNDYGNTWTYARIRGTETKGWISDAHLPLNQDGVSRGSLTHC
jgi:hypothetical protein